jgi:Leucine-rich repeat (LRR) protein
LFSLVDLVKLDVSHNKLTGLIPASIGNIRFLKVLQLSNNNLHGSIGKELGALAG